MKSDQDEMKTEIEKRKKKKNTDTHTNNVLCISNQQENQDVIVNTHTPLKMTKKKHTVKNKKKQLKQTRTQQIN